MTIEERKDIFKNLKANLKKIKLPEHPVKLNAAETIMDCKEFVKSHIAFIESTINIEICMPYLLRLIKFAELI